MATSKKRKRLVEGGLLHPQARLTKDQSAALESLTPEEIEAVISAKNKLQKSFKSLSGPINSGFSSGSQEANRIPTVD